MLSTTSGPRAYQAIEKANEIAHTQIFGPWSPEREEREPLTECKQYQAIEEANAIARKEIVQPESGEETQK